MLVAIIDFVYIWEWHYIGIRNPSKRVCDQISIHFPSPFLQQGLATTAFTNLVDECGVEGQSRT